MKNNQDEQSIYDSKEVFESYLEVASEKDAFLQHLQKHFQESDKPLSILELGCNEGDLTLKYLTLLASKLPKGSIIACVDPNERALEAFQNKELPCQFKFQFVKSTAEGYLFHNVNRYDWIIASHSLYWTPNLPSVIHKMLEISSNVVMVIREKDGLYTIEDRFKTLIPKKNNYMYSAEDIDAALKEAKATYSRETIRSRIPIPAFSDPKFVQLISFFLDTPVNLLNEDLLVKVKNFLTPFGDRFPYGVGFFWAKGITGGNINER